MAREPEAAGLSQTWNMACGNLAVEWKVQLICNTDDVPEDLERAKVSGTELVVPLQPLIDR